MAVYLDLVMVLNFLVDFLLILGTNRLSGFPPGWKGAALAALLGGLYSGACMLPGFSFLGSTLWRLIFLGLMGVTAFGVNRSAIKRTGVFVLLSMAMGGVSLGFGRGEFSMLVLSAVMVWLLCRVSFGRSIGGREFENVTICAEGTTATVTALRDSGNTLRDPITGEQVMVVGPDTAAKLTALSASDFLRPMETMLSHPKQGYRLIPYSAVGQPGSLLLAKRFEIWKTGGKKGSAIVAFAPEVIGAGDMYQALTGGVL